MVILVEDSDLNATSQICHHARHANPVQRPAKETLEDRPAEGSLTYQSLAASSPVLGDIGAKRAYQQVQGGCIVISIHN